MAMSAARRLWVGRSGPVHPLSPMVLTANDCDGWMETRDDEQNNCYNGATFFFEYH